MWLASTGDTGCVSDAIPHRMRITSSIAGIAELCPLVRQHCQSAQDTAEPCVPNDGAASSKSQVQGMAIGNENVHMSRL